MEKKNLFIGIIIGAAVATIISVLGFTGVFGLVKKPDNKQINPTADDVCKLKYYKIEDGKTDIEKNYGYKVTLNGKCDEYFVMDKNNEKSLFSIIVNKNEKSTSLYTTIGNYKDEAGYYKNKYNVVDDFDTYEFKFYMIDNSLLVFDARKYKAADVLPSAEGVFDRNIYVYQLRDNKKYWGFAESVISNNTCMTDGLTDQEGIPWRISDININENKELEIYTRISYPHDGVANGKSDKYYNIVMLLREIEVNPDKIDSIDINAKLQEYGFDDFAFERKFTYKVNGGRYEATESGPIQYLLSNGNNVTKTITQAYNEKVQEIRNGN